MNETEFVRFLEKTLQLQRYWITSADAKTAFAFAVNVAMLGMLATWLAHPAGTWGAGMSVAALTVILIISGFGCLCCAAFPKINAPQESNIYFAGIAERTLSAYRQGMVALPVESYIDDLIAQCYRHAEIAEKKTIWVQRSLAVLYATVLPWAAALWLLPAN